MNADPSQMPQWAQAIGTGLFALAVWWELRTQRAERVSERAAEVERADRRDAEVREILTSLSGDIRSLLERDRMRADTGPIRTIERP